MPSAVPSPSWPARLSPQHQAPPSWRTAQVCCAPAATAIGSATTGTRDRPRSACSPVAGAELAAAVVAPAEQPVGAGGRAGVLQRRSPTRVTAVQRLTRARAAAGRRWCRCRAGPGCCRPSTRASRRRAPRRRAASARRSCAFPEREDARSGRPAAAGGAAVAELAGRCRPSSAACRPPSTAHEIASCRRRRRRACPTPATGTGVRRATSAAVAELSGVVGAPAEHRAVRRARRRCGARRRRWPDGGQPRHAPPASERGVRVPSPSCPSSLRAPAADAAGPARSRQACAAAGADRHGSDCRARVGHAGAGSPTRPARRSGGPRRSAGRDAAAAVGLAQTAGAALVVARRSGSRPGRADRGRPAAARPPAPSRERRQRARARAALKTGPPRPRARPRCPGATGAPVAGAARVAHAST